MHAYSYALFHKKQSEFRRDLDWAVSTLYDGVLGWLKDIQDKDLKFDKDAIRYKQAENEDHRNYLNVGYTCPPQQALFVPTSHFSL